ncbi:desulfoferrodoxin [Clostridium isatidis]|uniref:Desulfoferrodoxin n=1 Tax=Clostridium isatidis TaxID=182773 RepID=A0A343JB36_9CLOT|nr:desulfoferrodoxin [Clostridium isatidis]ASW42744.1 desulfoferrodoxin [Clostridium isatidis]NLZ34514.1 desulfoferrodoxin [Clostridiales bacterium]
MIKKLGIYKCEVCGSVVEALRETGGKLVCCGKEMKLYQENTVDAAVEKHVPVYEEKDGVTYIKVGDVEHPMIPEHYIEWIEVITKDGKVYRQELDSSKKPEAEFKINGEIEKVRELCNIHGLWTTK